MAVDCTHSAISEDGPMGWRCDICKVHKTWLDEFRPAPRPAPALGSTPAGSDLINFFENCKAMGMRTGKGEFVASDGTRMPYDIAFERSEQKKGARDDG